MPVPQDQQPTRGHHARALLYEAGVSRVGVDAAESLRPHEVRRHGVRQIGKRIGQVVGAGTLVLGLAHLGAYAFDHSPTVRYQREHEQPAGPSAGGQDTSAEHQSSEGSMPPLPGAAVEVSPISAPDAPAVAQQAPEKPNQINQA